MRHHRERAVKRVNMVGDRNNDKMTEKEFISKMGSLGVYCSVQFIDFCDKLVSIGEKNWTRDRKLFPQK